MHKEIMCSDTYGISLYCDEGYNDGRKRNNNNLLLLLVVVLVIVSLL